MASFVSSEARKCSVFSLQTALNSRPSRGPLLDAASGPACLKGLSSDHCRVLKGTRPNLRLPRGNLGGNAVLKVNSNCLLCGAVDSR